MAGTRKGTKNKTEDSQRVHKRRYHPRVPKTLHGTPDPNFEALWGEDGTEADKHYSRLIFAERMLVMGYRPCQVEAALMKKHALSLPQAKEIIAQVKSEWVDYVNASDEERWMEINSKIDFVYLEAIKRDELTIAANIIKIKMNLYGYDTKNIHVSGAYTPEQLLGMDISKDATIIMAEESKQNDSKALPASTETDKGTS